MQKCKFMPNYILYGWIFMIDEENYACSKEVNEINQTSGTGTTAMSFISGM